MIPIRGGNTVYNLLELNYIKISTNIQTFAVILIVENFLIFDIYKALNLGALQML